MALLFLKWVIDPKTQFVTCLFYSCAIGWTSSTLRCMLHTRCIQEPGSPVFKSNWWHHDVKKGTIVCIHELNLRSMMTNFWKNTCTCPIKDLHCLDMFAGKRSIERAFSPTLRSQLPLMNDNSYWWWWRWWWSSSSSSIYSWFHTNFGGWQTNRKITNPGMYERK